MQNEPISKITKITLSHFILMANASSLRPSLLKNKPKQSQSLQWAKKLRLILADEVGDEFFDGGDDFIAVLCRGNRDDFINLSP